MRLLEAFYTRLGVREEQLKKWPDQRLKDYVTVWQLEHALNNDQQKSPAGAGALAARPGEVSSTEMAEMAYNAMKPETPATEGAVGPHPSAAVRAERAKLFE